MPPHGVDVRRSEDRPGLERTSSEARVAAEAILSPVLSRAREHFRENDALSGKSTQTSGICELSRLFARNPRLGRTYSALRHASFGTLPWPSCFTAKDGLLKGR